MFKRFLPHHLRQWLFLPRTPKSAYREQGLECRGLDGKE
jgi:hypothetical protein